LWKNVRVPKEGDIREKKLKTGSENEIKKIKSLRRFVGQGKEKQTIQLFWKAKRSPFCTEGQRD